jgi:hypothetical protein
MPDAVPMKRSLPAFGLLVVAACSSSESTSVEPGGQPLASETIDAGSTVCTAETLSVSRANVAINPPRDHHASLVRETDGGAFLYVFGGGTDEFRAVHGDVQRAEIHADGTLGGFAKLADMPQGRAGSGVAFTHDLVILTGGVVGTSAPAISDDTVYARLGRDGVIGEWKAGPALPRAVMHPSSVAHGDWVYVFGGTTGTAATAVSVRAKIEADGTLSEFIPTTKLSPARSHQAAFVYSGFIYLAGGLSENPMTNPPSRTDIVRAEIQADGSLGEWLPAGTLPVPLSVSAGELRGCSVYFFGGLSDSESRAPFTDTILRGTLAEDGSVVDIVAESSKLSVKRGHVHQTPSYGNFIFSVGGRGNDAFASLGTVDIGTFSK